MWAHEHMCRSSWKVPKEGPSLSTDHTMPQGVLRVLRPLNVWNFGVDDLRVLSLFLVQASSSPEASNGTLGMAWAEPHAPHMILGGRQKEETWNKHMSPQDTCWPGLVPT